MKIFAFALVAFVAGASALPHLQVEEAIRSRETRLVTNQIEQAIKDASQAIVDAGLDPFIIDQQSNEYALPVPSIFNYRASVTDLLFEGASKIVIDQLSFSLITLRLTFTIGLPEIRLNVGDSKLYVHFFGKDLNGSFSGSLAVKNIQTTGNIRFSIGIISGTTISSIRVTVKIGEIQSQLLLELLGVDFSENINKYLGQTVPETLNAFENDINTLVTIIAKDVIESAL